MTIKRNVNGIEMEFELTDTELYDAYEEKQHKYDNDAIDDYFCSWDDEDIKEEYGLTRTELEELYDEMSQRMRRYIDKYDCSWDYARDEAINDVLREEIGR
jgi:hypothetical protein